MNFDERRKISDLLDEIRSCQSRIEDFFRVADDRKVYIFNKRYVTSIEYSKATVKVHTVDNNFYELNMNIDEFLDYMEGRK